MGIQLARKKKRNFKLSLAYKLSKFIPLGATKRLKLFLDLSWIFSRLAHEQIFKTNIKFETSSENDILLSFIKHDSKVLDLGCGRGHVIRRLLSKTQNITGIDYDVQSIEAARKEIPFHTVKLVCDSIQNFILENPSTRFDYVILSHVIEHISEPQSFLKSIKGIADFFYIEVPDFEATHLNLYRQAVGTDLVYTDIDHVSEFDRNTLAEIFMSAGLEPFKSEFRFGVMKYWCKAVN